MPTLVKIVSKHLNPGLLEEQILAIVPQGLLLDKSFAGFDVVSERELAPSPEAKVVGSTSTPQGRTEDIAQPGELRFNLTRDLTTGENNTLDTLLANHDYTQRSQEQVREDTDISDIAALVGNLADFDNLIAQWDTLTSTQRLNALKAVLTNLRRLLRVLLRRACAVDQV